MYEKLRDIIAVSKRIRAFLEHMTKFILFFSQYILVKKFGTLTFIQTKMC